MPTALPPYDNNAKRRDAPVIGELPALAKPKDCHVGATGSALAEFVEVITDPELLTVVAFSLIGLLLALNFMLRFPDFGAVIEQYNQF